MSQETKDQPEVIETPERLFLLKEKAVNELFLSLQELPYKVASPFLTFLQKNLQEVKQEQVKETVIEPE